MNDNVLNNYFLKMNKIINYLEEYGDLSYTPYKIHIDSIIREYNILKMNVSDRKN